MSQQIRLRRAQDKRFQRTTEPEEADVVPLVSTTANAAGGGGRSSTSTTEDGDNGSGAVDVQQQLLLEARNMCYFCQKCKNHGILVWKKVGIRREGEIFRSITADHCPFSTTKDNVRSRTALVISAN